MPEENHDEKERQPRVLNSVSALKILYENTIKKGNFVLFV